MTRHLLPAVIALTRAWLRVYTRGLPLPLAESRCAEIESDLWEMLHDPELAPGLRSSWMALARLVDGMTDDVAWRVDNAALEEQFIVRRVCALTAATAVVLSLWSVPSLFLKGDRDTACAAAAAMPQTRAAILDGVIRCAGSFFSSSS